MGVKTDPDYGAACLALVLLLLLLPLLPLFPKYLLLLFSRCYSISNHRLFLEPRGQQCKTNYKRKIRPRRGSRELTAPHSPLVKCISPILINSYSSYNTNIHSTTATCFLFREAPYLLPKFSTQTSIYQLSK